MDDCESVKEICILGGISVSIWLLFGSFTHTYGLAAQFRQAQEELGEQERERSESEREKREERGVREN